MDPLTLALIVGVIVAVAVSSGAFGHHLGKSAAAALAKVRTDAQAFGHAVADDVSKLGAEVGQMPTGSVIHDIAQFVEHPITTTESALANHHLTTIQAAASALWDDSKSLAKIAEGQAEIDARAKLRELAAAAIAGKPTPVVPPTPAAK